MNVYIMKRFYIIGLLLLITFVCRAETGDSYHLTVGQTQKITLPYSVTSKVLAGQPVFTSSRPDDVKIVSQGYSSCDVKAVKAFSGYCMIHCTYYYNELDPTTGKYIYGRTGFIDFYVLVEAGSNGGSGGSSGSLSLNTYDKTLEVGESFVLVVSGADVGNWNLYCPDRYGRIIDTEGYQNTHTLLVEAVGAGDTYIQISKGNESVTCWIHVVEPKKITGVSIIPSTISLLVGEGVQLKAIVSPSDIQSDISLKWSSSDESVASVSSSGYVTAKSKGNMSIRCTAIYGGQNYSVYRTITVNEIVTKSKQVKLSNSGYATFYDSDFAYTLPSGLSAQVVTANSSGKLTYKTIANSNGVIPKGVPVILVNNSKTGGTYTLTSSTYSTSYTGSNLLRGSNSQTITSNVNGVRTSGNSNYVYYKLAYGKNGSTNANKLGWYWGANNGASFSIAGGKAWLALPKSSAQSLDAILLEEDDATSIDGIEQSNMNEANDAQYNMAGQRVGNGYNGIIIVNGKKVIR